MDEYVNDVIVTLKLKSANYGKQSDTYKELVYTIEMLECARKLTNEQPNSALN